MKRNRLKRLDKKRLRRWLLVFFLSLAIPTAVLVQQSYSRLKWEAFHQHRLMAEELTRRIDNQLLRLIDGEAERSFTDYAFLNVAGAPSANFLQRSPLSRYPVQAEIPGLIGYFQVDAAGRLSTPLLPEDIDKAGRYGLAERELSERAALQNRIRQILRENRLVKNHTAASGKKNQGFRDRFAARQDKAMRENEQDADFLERSVAASKRQQPAAAAPPPTGAGQAVFDELKKMAPAKSKQENSLGRLEDIKLKQTFQKEAVPIRPEESVRKALKAAPKKARTEQNVLPEPVQSAEGPAVAASEASGRPAAPAAQAEAKTLRIRTFESAVDPFEFSQLDSGQFVLFRKVWLNGRRYVQGLLIEKDAFLQGTINAAFQETALSRMSDLLAVFQGNVLSAFAGRAPRGYLSSADELQGELLYQDRLPDPFGDLQLVFSITQLPVGPGGWVIIWLSAVLSAVFLAGFYGMYRLGVGQIDLVNRQQDFVSAVSHELKTPLTSIRMYGEMLQAGWVDDGKKKAYYDFILDESERLTRLINNVLQLAKMTRNENKPALQSLTVAELIDGIHSKISTQIERSGFRLTLSVDQDAAEAKVKVNPDWFVQIMINLVDNAIKFSAKADIKAVDLSCQRLSGGRIRFTVRDYGPGIAKDQLKKIFRLFYRAENELTRETVGTGIGLALAHQMAVAMNGRIDVTHRDPGAEFRIDFPVDKTSENGREIRRCRR
jgi:signal transduction histidine kinase